MGNFMQDMESLLEGELSGKLLTLNGQEIKIIGYSEYFADCLVYRYEDSKTDFVVTEEKARSLKAVS